MIEQQLLQTKVLASFMQHEQVFQTAESALALEQTMLSVGIKSYDIGLVHIVAQVFLLSQDKKGIKSYQINITATKQALSLKLASEIKAWPGHSIRTWWYEFS